MEQSLLLFREVELRAPDVYSRILHIIRPHRIESIIRLFGGHLKRNVPDLNIFNTYRTNIPELLLSFVQASRKNFPEPGDAFGIQLTCRITKNDTQSTLDSKHLGSREQCVQYNVVKSLQYEIQLFSTSAHIFELATKRTFSSVLVRNYTVKELLHRLPEAGYLERGQPFNKCRDGRGRYFYVSTFKYILVKDKHWIRIVFCFLRDLNYLLRYLDATRIVAFTDIKYVFKKCGILCHFFNLLQLVLFQRFNNERDIVTVCKYQCKSGQPLPLNRDGLARNSERSPLEVLSFEAPKKNFVRFSTMQPSPTYPVQTSADKIFFGQQFNEGTGYHFALLPASKQTPVAGAL
ncbi:uncharacterized protein TNCT_729891 [Trichonephila clavata]|uniref:Uncharacterized protein n=1 Tax=Trichonephila clavata TaxID=2740835 RepID=A0A8X6F175_TRICU|nr:uncharacterized protein TNCT_729891 [Trichonephila clavata]